MSLEKTTAISSVSFSGQWKNLIVEHLITISENGVVINESAHRESYMIDEISTLPEELQPYAEGVWTEELREEYAEWEEERLKPQEVVELTKEEAEALEKN